MWESKFLSNSSTIRFLKSRSYGLVHCKILCLRISFEVKFLMPRPYVISSASRHSTVYLIQIIHPDLFVCFAPFWWRNKCLFKHFKEDIILLQPKQLMMFESSMNYIIRLKLKYWKEYYKQFSVYFTQVLFRSISFLIFSFIIPFLSPLTEHQACSTTTTTTTTTTW